MGIEIKRCPHCDIRVVPSPQGICPSCRVPFPDKTNDQLEFNTEIISEAQKNRSPIKSSFDTGCGWKILLVAAFFLSPIAYSLLKVSGASIAAIFIVIFALRIFFGTWGSEVREQKEIEGQIKRNRHAKAAITGKDDRFSLYLRPFVLDSELLIFKEETASEIIVDFMKYFDSGSRSNSLEEVIAEAMEPYSPLISFHSENETFGVGAGKVTSLNHEWKSRFAFLAERAQQILIIPFISEGILWEMHWLKNKNKLSKCMFIMPPTEQKNWEEISELFKKEFQLTLPSHYKNGAIFKYKSQFDSYDILVFKDKISKMNLENWLKAQFPN